MFTRFLSDKCPRKKQLIAALQRADQLERELAQRGFAADEAKSKADEVRREIRGLYRTREH